MAKKRFLVAIDDVFGMLTIVSPAYPDKQKKPYWICQCSCGMFARIGEYQVRRGLTKSCGCLQKEIMRLRKTHGRSRTREYNIWSSMLARCQNPRSTHFSFYGARGINVCERWKKFEYFFTDMGECPLGLSLDRIDNSLGYSLENCRWSTPKEQARNTRSNRFLTFCNQIKSSAEWAEIFVISQKTLWQRLRSGWTVEDALTKPVHKSGHGGKETT
jgi:hypothetical protein